MYSEKEKKRLNGANGVGSHEKYRNVFRKDYARLIHAPSFRRLQNKTQLFPGLESDFFRNRLTHSIEVAQIAGGIAEKINADSKWIKDNNHQIDIDLVQFAGMAHDLGHPPFGHNGEAALDDMMKSFGGFEGNAQTLRILTRLEKKTLANQEGADESTYKLEDQFGRLGLNLTFRTLASILKYDTKIPATRNQRDSLVKGYYDSESRIVEKIKEQVGNPKNEKFKTIECQIMDIADDISYSTYDLEDTLKGGFLSPMDLIRHIEMDPILIQEINKKIAKSSPEMHHNDVTKDEIIEDLLSTFFEGTEDESIVKNEFHNFAKYYTINKSYMEDGYVRTTLSAWLVGNAIDAIEFKENNDHPPLSKVFLKPEIHRKIEIRKHLNYQLIIKSPRLAVVQHRGYDVVKKIFKALTSDKGRDLMPVDFRNLYDACKNIHEQRRVVCDFISGMTDRYAIEFYSRLYDGDQSIFKPF